MCGLSKTLFLQIFFKFNNICIFINGLKVTLDDASETRECMQIENSEIDTVRLIISVWKILIYESAFYVTKPKHCKHCSLLNKTNFALPPFL